MIKQLNSADDNKFAKKISVSICVYLWTIFLCFPVNAQTLAPNAPGKDAQWASAGKQGVGTSATLESKVWFTLQGGAMTEVYYPDVTTANVHLLQFVAVNSKTGKIETERDDAIHKIDSKYGLNLNFVQINEAKSGEWRINKSYVTDSDRNSVQISVTIIAKNKDLKFYLYYDPSLANSGMHDTAWTDGGNLLACDGDKCSALVTYSGFKNTTNGFLGTSDGLTQLRQKGSFINYQKAENGNIVQFAELETGKYSLKSLTWNLNKTFVLGFGKTSNEALQTAQATLKEGNTNIGAKYKEGWKNYVETLPKVDEKYQAQFNMAAMILKAHEDKTNRGANIASLSVPWGGGENANENNVGGYHLVWSRDLYQVATAYMALGDKAAATRALDFVFNVQQKPDGSFPQNSFLDGKPFWGSLQLDEVAYPLILAYQLGKNDKTTYEKHIRSAADFIVKNGPKTPQERWEEEGGFSPSTIAAEIAGLICAADIAKKNGDEASALIYTATADDWARNVERWTATTTGKYGDGNYYVRITQNGKPDAGEKIELNNGAGFFDEREVVDAGFLELVRLGIKSPDDKLIAKSVKVIDSQIKVLTPNGYGFYRYNHDGYGEMDDGRRWNWDGKYTGKGRLWALLSGERGQYELAKAAFYNNKNLSFKENLALSLPHLVDAGVALSAMLGFANEGLMIPEQIWDKKEAPQADSQFSPNLKFGEGTGSATPLAWSSAQFIRLAVNLQAGKNLDTPDVVYNRYVRNGIPGRVNNFGGMDEEVVLPSLKTGEIIKFPRAAQPKTKVAYQINGETRVAEADEKGQVLLEFKMPAEDFVGVFGIESPDGATAFERVKFLLKPKQQEFSPALVEKIKNAKTSPLVENGKAILFYRGAAKSVSVAGDMTGWNPGRIFMQDIGENLKAVQLDFAPTARVEYKLIADGNWILDEANPNKMDNGVGGENSLFTMPEYKPTDWTNSVGMTTAAISIERVSSKIYGERELRVYVPEGFSNQALPVMYFQDGGEYLKRAEAVTVQRNLVKAGKIKPFIMVFLDPKDRNKEYWASDDYAKFLATEVVPMIDAKYSTVKNREGRAILGASLGGITSVWTGLKYPETFARIGGQSSSFWVDNERVVKELAKLDAQETKFRFYFDDGTLEGVEDTRRVNVMLRGKGFPVRYVEGETGHNWTSWRDRLADAFVALWQN
ncbi:MAG: glycoside hydrolase family 15 protein [Pyrinomonadaceae bacterium]